MAHRQWQVPNTTTEKLNNICVQAKPTSAIDIVNNIDGYDSRV